MSGVDVIEFSIAEDGSHPSDYQPPARTRRETFLLADVASIYERTEPGWCDVRVRTHDKFVTTWHVHETYDSAVARWTGAK